MIPPPDRLDPAENYLVGISGGRDSIFLHHWLQEHGFQSLLYCHLNHGLRGAESDDDESFLGNLLGDQLISEKVNVGELAAERKLSVETAAREARLDFFTRCADQTGRTHLILAHHAEDQAETILFNLLRGSSGAKGMPFRQSIGSLTVIRPMLNLRRSEIDTYLNSRSIPYREDSSNKLPFATRNRLRNEVFPLLSDILNRDPVPSLIRAFEQTAEVESIVDQLSNQRDLTDPQGRLFLPILRELEPPLQRRVLFNYLKEHQIPQISATLIKQALALLPAVSAPSISLPRGRRLRRKESRIFISS